MKRIPVAGISDRPGKRTWRCKLGFHRVRFMPDWSPRLDVPDRWVPRCADCRLPALWWQLERGVVIRDVSGRSPR